MQNDLPLATWSAEWAVLQQFLPFGWEEEARKRGALRRARGVADAKALLRVLLMHLAAGYSLVETAARAERAGLARVSSVALFKRLQAAEDWLRWLAVEERKLLGGDLPDWGRTIRAVDATTVSEPGSTGTDWRLHFALNLNSLQCDFFELTEVGGGETLRRIPVSRGELILADGGYSHPPGVAHVVAGGADLIVRLNHRCLPLYHGDGRRLSPLAVARRQRVGEIRVAAAWVHPAGGAPISGRLVVVRRSTLAARQARKKLVRKASRRGQRLAPETLRLAGSFMLWTSLPEPVAAAAVLELYRRRWQIELNFKRMKSILGFGHLPKKDPASARAWLHGKLLTSLLIERTLRAANAVSPWGYGIPFPPLPLA